MNINKAIQLAVIEMEKHNLISQGWTFRMDNAKRRFGLCEFTNKVISLSRYMTHLNEEAEVLDIIRHEIAHALAGFKAGHGILWKRKAIEVGARPEMYYSENKKIVKVKGNYEAVCPSCGNVSRRFRAPKANYSCSLCCPPHFNAEYLLVWKKVEKGLESSI